MTHDRISEAPQVRPDSGIQSNSWLHPYSLQQLKLSDVEALIHIYAAKEDADEIFARVEDADIKVKDLLTSPIFVILLIIRFEYSHQIPRNIVAFYADLFDALARRHNQDAGGLKREISSGLQPRQSEKAFESICFLIHKRFGNQPAHIRSVEKIAEEHSKSSELSSDAPILIVDDIIRITNLMLEEAGLCEFIHKSVKEYYAAVHVAENAVDAQAEKFYTSLLSSRWREWKGTLWFLEQIDRLRYLRYFAIPGLKSIAPYQSPQIARSFRKVRIIGDETSGYTFQFPLNETECFALARQKQFTFFSSANVCELRSLMGDEETQHILDELNTAHEFYVDWKELQQRCDEQTFNESPIIKRLWDENSAQEFKDLLRSWDQELLLIQSPDSDFEIC